MPRWILNCKDFAALESQRLDRPLTFRDRLAIRIHLVFCPPCHCIRDQFESIRNACRWMPQTDTGTDPEKCVLPDEVRKRIKTVLKNHSI